MSLTVDGTEVQNTDFSIWFDVRRGGPNELAALAGVDTVIPGQEGYVPKPREKRGRVIELHGWLHGSSVASLEDAEDDMMTLFDPGSTVTLVLTRRNSDTATILAQVESIIPDDMDFHGSTRYYTITLTSGAPDWTIA